MDAQNTIIYHGTSSDDEFIFPKCYGSPFVWFSDSFEAAQRYARLRYMENGGVPRVLKYIVKNEKKDRVLVIENIHEYARAVFGDDYSLAISGKHSAVFRARRNRTPPQPWEHFHYMSRLGLVGFTEPGISGSTDWVFMCDSSAERSIHTNVVYIETIYV
jgi:hypothetical protein